MNGKSKAENIEGLDDVNELIETVSVATRQWAIENLNDPDQVRINELYINGSFGAKQGDRNSDIDLTVGIHQLSQLTCQKATAELYRSLDTHHGRTIDICILSSCSIVAEHLQERCRHGQYDTVYDLFEGTYTNVQALSADHQRPR